MGNLHKDLGDNQQAKDYYERALCIQLNKLGPDHVDVARTYCLIGDMQLFLDAQQPLSRDDRAQLIQPINRTPNICSIV